MGRTLRLVLVIGLMLFGVVSGPQAEGERMAVKYVDAGGDLTANVIGHNTSVGSPSASTDNPHTGPRSYKFTSSGSPTFFQDNTFDGNIGDDARVSLWVYLNSLPSATTGIFAVQNIAGVSIFEVRVTTAGVLQLFANGVQVGSNGSTLSTGQWYHLVLATSITSTTVNEARVFVGDSTTADISASNVTTASASPWYLKYGWFTGQTGGLILYVDDIYADDDNGLTNPGLIRVTAKRPNVTTDGQFDTAIGANPANRYDNINERPFSNTNGWKRSASAASLQKGRPDGLIAAGSWTASSGVNIWDRISEVTADDDSSYATRTGNGGTLEVSLSDVTDPLSSSGHIVRWRVKVQTGSGGAESLQMDLVQGATVIATQTNNETRGSYVTHTLTLSAAQADSITDYTNLRLRFTPTQGASEVMRVTQAELEVPGFSTSESEAYAVETAGEGDVDITNATILGYDILLYGLGTAGNLPNYWRNGVSTLIPSSSTFIGGGIYHAYVTGSSYPSDARATGFDVSTGILGPVSLYDTGISIAYIESLSTVVRHWLALLGVGS